MDVKFIEVKSKVNLKNNVRKNKNKKKRYTLIVVLCVLLSMMGILWQKFSKWKKTVVDNYVPTVEVTKDKYYGVDGVTNVLLIGTDARNMEEQSRSDSVIIATLDRNNNQVKLTTLMRDTLVDIPDYGKGKLNAAYAYGGPELLLETIRANFDIDISEYVAVNFQGFESIIDIIGGVEVDVKDYEVDEINKFIGEVTGGNDCPIYDVGTQTLNGKQALAYARIRYNSGDEYERTERQRNLLTKIAKQLITLSPTKYNSLMDSVVPYLRTNIQISKALQYARDIKKLKTLEVKQLQIPINELAKGGNYSDEQYNYGWVFLIDWQQNIKFLKEFIFDNKMPDPQLFDYDAFDVAMSQYNYGVYEVNEDYNDYTYDENLVETPVEEEDLSPVVDEPISIDEEQTNEELPAGDEITEDDEPSNDGAQNEQENPDLDVAPGDDATSDPEKNPTDGDTTDVDETPPSVEVPPSVETPPVIIEPPTID